MHFCICKTTKKNLYKISDGTEFVGKSIYFLPKCHSTNDIAAELLDKGLVGPGSVIITDHQTAGKGQRGNSWESECGKNLTFSIVLIPDFIMADKNFSLNIVTSLALTDAFSELDILRQYKDAFFIKWPNDIYYEQNKLGGILIENSIISGKIGSAIIGIGLNVNQLSFEGSFPATSLQLICSVNLNLNDLLNLILKCFDKRCKTLYYEGIHSLESDYLNMLYGLGKTRKFAIDGKISNGIIRGIDSSGRLVVSIENEDRVFSYQEIKFLN